MAAENRVTIVVGTKDVAKTKQALKSIGLQSKVMGWQK